MKVFARLSLLVATVVLSSCYSAQKKEEVVLDQKVSAEKPANTPESIVDRAATAFSSIEGLTPEQRSKLSTVYTRVYTESRAFRRELGQSKSLLFKTLATPNYKASEISLLKKKITSLDQQRLNLMFGALDEVQAIVGKGVGSEKIYKHFEDYEIPRHDYN